MLYQDMRPERFDDMKGQESIVENIRNQSKRNTWFQVYILGGQFGSGKTSMARIIAKASNCRHKDENGNPCLRCDDCKSITNGSLDYKEIDGASNTGVDNIRELKDWLSYRPTMQKYKVVTIDEVHMLSTNAFNSLLKILEEPPKYAIVILCTTNVNDIPVTVQSRCACYSFGRIPEYMIAEHVKTAALKYQIEIEDSAANIIAKHSSGAMRNALKLLEQLGASGEKITAELCREVIGISNEDSVFGLLDSVLQQDLPSVIEMIGGLERIGKNLSVLADDLLSGCSDLIIACCCGADNIGGTELYCNLIKTMISNYSLARFCELSEQITNLRQAMKIDSSKNQFIIQVVTLMQHLKKAPDCLAAKIEALEQEINNLQDSLRHVTTPVSVDAKEETDLEHVEENSEVIHETCQQTEDTEMPAEQSFESEVVISEELPIRDGSASDRESVMVTETEDEFFSDDWLESGMESQDFHKLFNNESIGDKQIKSDGFGSLPLTADEIVTQQNNSTYTCALEAEKQLEILSLDNPEIASHIKVGCKKEYNDQGLMLITPELSVCNMLLLYIGRSGIKNINIVHDPKVDL